MTVLLPQAVEAQIGVSSTTGTGGEPPVLYLLHGLSDDHTAWLRNTSIDRYATARGLAVVMPQVQRSFYADEVHGGRYWTFLSEELPEVVGSFFRVSTRREDTFVAGLSMGGYGALKLALRQPHRFAAAASMSAVTDLDSPGARRHRPEDPRLMARLFDGREVAGTDDDLLHLVDTAAPAVLPALHVSCGTEDELLGDSLRFTDRCAAVGIPVTTSFGPGEHDWDYWDDRIQDVLRWLPITRPVPTDRS